MVRHNVDTIVDAAAELTPGGSTVPEPVPALEVAT